MSHHDTLILGAGPAGLQLGWCLENAGRDYLIVDRADHVGSFWTRFPRNGKLISFNKRHGLYDDPEMLLRWDWNSLLCNYEMPFTDFSPSLYPTSAEMAIYLKTFASRYALRTQLSTSVQRVTRDDDGFTLQTSRGPIHGRRLVIATGLSKPWIPPIEGIELVHEAYENASFDADDYIGRRVLVLGKGNSAFEFADALLDTAALLHLASPHSVRMAWKTRHPGHLRADYARFLDAYQLKLLHSVLDGEVRRIRRHGEGFAVQISYSHAEGELEELYYDRVVRCTGFAFDASIYEESCCPKLCRGDRFPELDPEWAVVGVPDLYVAGTLMQQRDFKRAASAFIDGFRYNVRTLFHLLEERYEDCPLPCRRMDAEAGTLTEHLLHRICRTSGLWTQFGYLCDALVVRDGEVAWFEELPLDAATQHRFADEPHLLTITFEWGAQEGDVFALQRFPRADAAHHSAFLHPVIRRWRFGVEVEAHHMLEDLLGMYSAAGETGTVLERGGMDVATWHRVNHEEPLLAFVAHQLAGMVPCVA